MIHKIRRHLQLSMNLEVHCGRSSRKSASEMNKEDIWPKMGAAIAYILQPERSTRRCCLVCWLSGVSLLTVPSGYLDGEQGCPYNYFGARLKNAQRHECLFRQSFA